MAKTYTIAHREWLYACVPDGDDAGLDRELQDADSQRNDNPDIEPISRDTVTIEGGLILTDNAPENRSRIVWRGQSLGCLTDEHGMTYDYAIRA